MELMIIGIILAISLFLFIQNKFTVDFNMKILDFLLALNVWKHYDAPVQKSEYNSYVTKSFESRRAR